MQIGAAHARPAESSLPARFMLTLLCVSSLLVLLAARPAVAEIPPARLSETGLFFPGKPQQISAGVLSFSPQYPLWSDGATKRRWIYLPPGSSIDARNPDAWAFPVGTRLWKEFAHERAVETRMLERLADGSWQFAAYVWRADGSDADLAPDAGVKALPVTGAPGGLYAVPSADDCRACHEGNAVPVLGFSALQLSPDRDPNAPHVAATGPDDVDLAQLVERGLLRNLPEEISRIPPRIEAATPEARAVLGYLHGNCGHCHNDPQQSGAGVPVDLQLAHYVAKPEATADSIRSLLDRNSRFRSAAVPNGSRAELVAWRMATRDPRLQMPPIGTQIPDAESLALVKRWLSAELPNTKETEQ